MKIYLDACCLNRPFDDQSQDRIRLESEAVEIIMDLVVKGRHEWYSSEALENEILRHPDTEKRLAILSLLTISQKRLLIDEESVSMAQSFANKGIGAMDALHLALAIKGGCEVLLTTDDTFLERVNRLAPKPAIRVENPARWLVEVIEL